MTKRSTVDAGVASYAMDAVECLAEVNKRVGDLRHRILLGESNCLGIYSYNARMAANKLIRDLRMVEHCLRMTDASSD